MRRSGYRNHSMQRAILTNKAPPFKACATADPHPRPAMQAADIGSVRRSRYIDRQ
jgi:hypothetical protein